MNNKAQYCCEAFNTKVTNAGRRGLAFLVSENSRGFFWVMQSRGVDHNDEVRLNKPNVDVNVAAEIAMKFCPFCGTELVIFNNDWMHDLNCKHKPFICH
jgi:hypothetical protein